MERRGNDSSTSEEEKAPTPRRPTVAPNYSITINFNIDLSQLSASRVCPVSGICCVKREKPVPVKADSTSITKKIKKKADSDRDENDASYKKRSSSEYSPGYNESDDSEVEAPPLKKVKYQRKKASLFDVKKENGNDNYKYRRTSPNGTKGDGRNSKGKEESLNDKGVKTKKKESESGSSDEEEDGEATQPALKSVKSGKAAPTKRAEPEREDSDSSGEPEFISAKTKKTGTKLELESDDSKEGEASDASEVVTSRRKTVEGKTSRPVVSDSSGDDTESFLNSAKILVMLKRMANRRDGPEPEMQSPELIRETSKRRKREPADDGLNKLKVLRSNKPKAAKRLKFCPSSEDTGDSE